MLWFTIIVFTACTKLQCIVSISLGTPGRPTLNLNFRFKITVKLIHMGKLYTLYSKKYNNTKYSKNLFFKKNICVFKNNFATTRPYAKQFDLSVSVRSHKTK